MSGIAFNNYFAQRILCCIISHMKKACLLTYLFLVFLTGSALSAQTWRKWEFINPADLQITVSADSPEIIAGQTATFTINIRNRTDKTLQIPYKTGQQWDLAVYHDRTQIYRWSQGLTWADAPHSIPLKAGEIRSEKLSWTSIDRNGLPLPQGVYKIQGMVMTMPRYLVSNDCAVRLLPGEIKKTEIIETRLNQVFKIEVPRYSGNRELIWKIDYVYNDNRIDIHRVEKLDKKTIIFFHPKRVGHVTFHLFAFHDTQDVTVSLERRTFRIEVK
jgi:hypothetical protein